MSPMHSTQSITSLLHPLQLGPLNLRNRIVMSPLTRSRAVPTNVPTDLMRQYYVQRVKGGAGLIISEGTLISRQGSVVNVHITWWCIAKLLRLRTEWENAPGIWNKEQVIAWKKITDAVHAEGGLIFCQVNSRPSFLFISLTCFSMWMQLWHGRFRS
jgi:2,4-dienoyl-CoA reductase-like NADH-dependent reductase (Old Yellow Enzyme family)